MKIDISSIDRESFYVNEHIWNGELVYLVTPRQIGVEWNKENLHYRSSLWNSNGDLISASYPKFFNFSEKPDLSPIPTNLNGATIVTKLDGSTIVISKYKGKFIIRSRGTIDAYTLTTGAEMDILKAKYPKLFEGDAHMETWDYSVITEYVSPNNQIVIKYNEVDFILTGVIFHNDYSLMTQFTLDVFAKVLDMKRPETFTFNSLDELLLNVAKWLDKEGVVLYCNDGQQLLKIKAAKYLFLHRMKSELSSTEKVLDVWMSQNRPSYQDFYNFILTTFDYELAEYCKANIEHIIAANDKVNMLLNELSVFIEPLKQLPRKNAARIIIDTYPNYKSYCFTLLDNTILNGNDFKKLLISFLKP